MANGTSAAVTEATRLEEIGFPEFTTKLVTDVFDALVSSNIRQTQSHIELQAAVGKSLSEFVNDTHDDISGSEILEFLARVLPPPNPDTGATEAVDGANLAQPAVDSLNRELAVDNLVDPATGNAIDNRVAAPGALDKAKLDTIYQAVARRIAANRYALLKELVTLGLLRIVVENGVVETRLTFTTYGSTFYQTKSSDYNRKNFKFKAKARTGGLISLWAKAAASTKYTNTTVRVAKEANRDVSGSRVEIYGGVTINFKTDYLPLNQ